MHRTITALTVVTVITASFSATPLVADTEFEDNIPIELARALLSGVGNATDVKIYSDIPDSFPEFDLPDGVTLAGSVDQSPNQQVLLRSDGDGTDQQAALIESLQDRGYLLIAPPATAMQQTGFISPSAVMPSIPAQLCHDSQGLVYIRLQPQSDHTFINITMRSYASQVASTCAEQAAQRGGAARSPAFFSSSAGFRSLQNSMPRLALPEDAATTHAQYRSAFVSASPDHAESKTDFTIDWSLADVQTFFAEQITEQGWTLDSDSAGDRVALGAWTREDNNRLLLGTLQLVSKDDDRYEAVFSVSLLD